METSKPNFQIRGRAAWVAAIWVACLLTSGAAPDASNLAAREQSRRHANIEEAQELLRKGDEAYQAGRYPEAVEAYAGAREMIPDAPVSAELRAAATERYAQAAVELARQLSHSGDVPGAMAAVDKVLSEKVAPNHPSALAFRAQLDDPIRTNPALTDAHAKNVNAVRRLLYTAEGAHNLGKFDEAIGQYKEVLRIDPTNSAARRGMETVAAAKSAHSKSAYDSGRAEMLSQVDAAWELQVPASDFGPGAFDPGGLSSDDRTFTIAAKLKGIIIPKIALDQASLDEALDFIRVKAVENDTLELDPARKGVNITVDLGPPESETTRSIRARRFDLQISQVPLVTALKYITEVTQTSFSTDEFAVVIRPAGFTSDELIARTFRVPPDFISSLSAGAEAGGANDDPFAAAPAGGGLLTTRLSAQQALSLQGVSFPDGASANYNPSTNTMRVVNTASNLDFISQIVETMSNTEPVMVSVRVTMIRTEKTNLEELGFDWLVNPFSLNSQNSVFGAGGTNGNTPGRTGADFSGPMPGLPPPDAVVNPGVVTNGLRSGDQATNSNSIDSLIGNPNRDVQTDSVAPGIMSLTGLFTDGQVQMLMRGLNQKKNVDIMAQPSTVTRSGQASTVQIIREFIYPTEYEPPELPNSVGFTSSSTFPVTPATPTAFETKDIGMTLEVLPVADAGKRYVDVTINPSMIDFDGFINYGSPINTVTANLLGGFDTQKITSNTILMPVFSSQKAATQLTVADGATIAIGGLMSQRIQIVEDKVPVLGNLPWVGRLFTTSARRPVSAAVVFLVHIQLLDPTGRPYRDR